MGSMMCDNADIGYGLTVLAVGTVDGLLSITNNGLTSDIAISIPGGGQYHYRMWLSDSATDATQTLVPPDQGGGVSEWSGVTDTDGEVTISIGHNGTERTWYMWGYFNEINISGAITAGT